MRRIKEFFYRIVLLAISFVASLGLAEICLRVFEPFEMRLHGNEIRLATNHTKVIENPGYSKLDPVIRHTKNDIGFRGENPPQNFDDYLTIVAIGGSTTEGFYLSDGDTWPELLSKSLEARFRRVWVNNAGLDGHSTFGHAYLLRDYLAPIPPKLATYLVGVNEVGLDRLNRFDNFFVNVSRLDQKSLFQAILDGEDRLVTLSRYSYVANFGLTFIRALGAGRAGLRHTQIDVKATPPLGMTDAERDAQLEAHRHDFAPLYEQRLTQLIQLSRFMKIEPILITQPALWGRGIDPTTGVDLGPISDFFWDRLEIYNQVTRRVGAALDVPVIDLGAKMPKDSRYYYDWMHFTKEGSARVAEIVSLELIPIVAARYPNFLR